MLTPMDEFARVILGRARQIFHHQRPNMQHTKDEQHARYSHSQSNLRLFSICRPS
jgi:hypothetical protein